MNLNNLTLKAIEELESGGGKKFSSFKSLIIDLEEQVNNFKIKEEELRIRVMQLELYFKLLTNISVS